MGRRLRLVHRDGRRWTSAELTEVVRTEREHDGTWPYDAGVFDVASNGSTVYILDACTTWHAAPLCTDGVAEDMVVVWDE